MTSVIRSISTCLLLLLLASFALADGGETHAGGLASPPPPPTECTAPCVSTEPPYPVPEDPSPSEGDLKSALVNWLTETLL